MILEYRADYLAKFLWIKPILTLCYNKPLAQKLEATEDVGRAVKRRKLPDQVLLHRFYEGW